jgi:hypothetical protein
MLEALKDEAFKINGETIMRRSIVVAEERQRGSDHEA